MNRRTARENAFIAAFELGFGAQSLEELVEYSEECGEYALDDFAQNLLRCYVEHTAQVDEMIRPRLKNWTLERLPRTSRTLLRLAITEMRFSGAQDVDSIVINEAVELAKKYGSDGDYQFINGVLGSIARAGTATCEAQETKC